jgi:hypothetical protein
LQLAEFEFLRATLAQPEQRSVRKQELALNEAKSRVHPGEGVPKNNQANNLRESD